MPHRPPQSPTAHRPPPASPKAPVGAEGLYGYYASSWAVCETDDAFPRHGEPASFVETRIRNYSLLDFKPQLNTASYINIVAEPEEQSVALAGLAVNIADQTVYPGSMQCHDDTLNMVASLWNCARAPSFDEYGCYPGAGTIGSTEACLLAGLALKFRWRKWYGQVKALNETQVRREYPNLVISTLFQAAWEKLFKYMDIEPRFAPVTASDFCMDPDTLQSLVDDHTIGVVCILGNHYAGQYDPVQAVGEALEKINREHGWQVGIHVDAASGGFIAPFQCGLAPFDFRVPQVLSINGSGHKFGQSCCGTGWIVWRDRTDLSDHVAVMVSYLGGKLYKFYRLGREGYTRLCSNMMNNAAFIRRGLASFRDEESGKPTFRMLDHGDSGCLPVVAAMLNPELEWSYGSIDMQHALATSHWFVAGYEMSYSHPVTGEDLPLLTDMPGSYTMFRIVVKANLTVDLAKDLLHAFGEALAFLDRTDGAFAEVHGKKASQHHRNHVC